MNLEPAIKSEVKSERENKYHMLTQTYGIQKDGTDEQICRAAIETQTLKNGVNYSTSWAIRNETAHAIANAEIEWREQHGSIYTTICKIGSQWEFAV